MAALAFGETDLNQLDGESDEELTRRARAGSEAAFAELMNRHRPALLRRAASILRDHFAAQDEFQNACWSAWRNLHTFHGEARFSTWMTRIVINHCLMSLRRKRRSRWLYLEQMTGEHETRAIELPDPGSNPEERFGTSEMGRRLAQEVRRIPPLLRNVVVLRDLQELPFPYVADRLGISVPAAKSRLLRARQELRSRLERHQGSPVRIRTAHKVK